MTWDSSGWMMLGKVATMLSGVDSRPAWYDWCRADELSGEGGCTMWQVGRCGGR